MLRRAGAFSAPADSPALLPLDSDSPEALEKKWKKFISRESYKRYVVTNRFCQPQGLTKSKDSYSICFPTTSKHPFLFSGTR